MELTAGYKRTEIGAIPEDWELISVGDAFKFSGGSQPPRDTFIFNPKKEFIRLLQIRDYKTDKYASYIPINLANKFCNKDDIMIGRYGPPIFQILNGLEGAYNVALLKAIPNNRLDKHFALFFLKQTKLFDFVEKLSQRTSGQTGVDLVELKKYLFPLPPLPEQTAIATVLSDTDNLIQALEKKIAKKQLIKKGAMQKLLTPKDGWEVKSLGEVCEIRKGQLITSSTKIDGHIPVIAGGKTPAYYHKYSNREGKTITISGSGANAGYVAFHHYPIFASDCSTISESKSFSIEFIYFFLQRIQDRIYKSQTGGAQPHIHPSDLNPIKIPFLTMQKQTRIAQILSDMDSEIETLENKLVKYKQLKEGLMQNLLTGKIRLV
jgi:type I restriction enzyme, S subunit